MFYINRLYFASEREILLDVDQLFFCLGFLVIFLLFFCLFFLLQRWQLAEGEIFLTNCCCLLALFLYGSIVLTILTPKLLFMSVFVIDPMNTTFKALMHSRDTIIHF